MDHEAIEFVKRTLVDQRRDALARRVFSAFMLLRNRLSAGGHFGSCALRPQLGILIGATLHALTFLPASS